LIKLIKFKVELKTKLTYPSFLFCGNHERVESRILQERESLPVQFQSVTPKLIRDGIWNEIEIGGKPTT
jgi:hypothetical protein